MVTEADIPTVVHLNTDELWVTMFKLWGLSAADMQEVSGFAPRRIKTACTGIIAKLCRGNPANLAFEALKAKFDINGTYKGEDIFSDDMKRKILLIKPAIQFLNPPGKKK